METFGVLAAEWKRKGEVGEAGSCPGAKAKTAEWNYSCSIVYNGRINGLNRRRTARSLFVIVRAGVPPAAGHLAGVCVPKVARPWHPGHAPAIFETSTRSASSRSRTIRVLTIYFFRVAFYSCWTVCCSQKKTYFLGELQDLVQKVVKSERKSFRKVWVWNFGRNPRN